MPVTQLNKVERSSWGLLKSTANSSHCSATFPSNFSTSSSSWRSATLRNWACWSSSSRSSITSCTVVVCGLHYQPHHNLVLSASSEAVVFCWAIWWSQWHYLDRASIWFLLSDVFEAGFEVEAGGLEAEWVVMCILRWVWIEELDLCTCSGLG